VVRALVCVAGGALTTARSARHGRAAAPPKIEAAVIRACLLAYVAPLCLLIVCALRALGYQVFFIPLVLVLLSCGGLLDLNLICVQVCSCNAMQELDGFARVASRSE
jgi:hypothetical protein